MEIIKNNLKKYFKDGINTAVFIILLIIFIYAIILRFKNLGVLSYWGYDWQTFLGTIGVLEHGYPQIPSGDILFNSILHFYLRAVPALISRVNDILLRFPNALFGALVIPLIFIFVKDLLNNKYIALLSSIIVALNAWQIELSREIGYYSEYQFFYLLSIYLFYRGFFKEEKNFKVTSIVFIFFTILINELGITLIFLFIPLLIYKRFKNFFRKDIIISFFIVAAVITGYMLLKELWWKPGFDFYNINISSDANSSIPFIIPGYFTSYSSFYNQVFKILFPDMYYFVFFGIILIPIYLFVPGIRNKNEDFVNIYSNPKYSIKLPFNLFFLYFIFYASTAFNGFVGIPGHQVFIYQVHPIFIVIYCYVIFNIGRMFANFFRNSINKNKISGKYPNYLKKTIYFSIIAIIFFLTVNWANPVYNFKITTRDNGDEVISEFAPINTPSTHEDTKTPGNYIYNHKEPGDIIITTDPLDIYGYTKQVDYRLYTGDSENWQITKNEDGALFDTVFNIPIISDIYQLFDVFNNNPDKNIWLITPYPESIPEKLSPDIIEFINNQEQYKAVTGIEKIWSAYLFPQIENNSRDFFFEPSGENIINVKIIGSNPFIIGFGNKNNKPYLKYGWSNMESQGTWADSKQSVLFFNFEKKQDYIITIETRTIFDPEKKQQMDIIFNGTEVYSIIYENPDINKYSFKLKEEFIKMDDYNTMEFNYKYQFNPLSMGISTDARDLSVFITKIIIEKQ